MCEYITNRNLKTYIYFPRSLLLSNIPPFWNSRFNIRSNLLKSMDLEFVVEMLFFGEYYQNFAFSFQLNWFLPTINKISDFE